MAFFLALGAVGLTRGIKRRRLVLDRLGASELIEQASRQPGLGGALGRLLSPFLLKLGAAAGPRSERDVEASRLKLVRAGLRGKNSMAIYHGLRLTLASVFLGGFMLLRARLFPSQPLVSMAICFMSIALGSLYLCDLGLRLRIRARQDSMRKGLPDALDLLVVCVEAGLALDAALDRVSREMSGKNAVVSEELKTVIRELRAGRPRHEALKDMSMRVGLEDVDNLVAVLVQTDIYGTSVARTLRVFSDGMRSKRYMRAEEKAAQLPVKITVPMIVFIFPALFVATVGSAVIKVMEMFH